MQFCSRKVGICVVVFLLLFMCLSSCINEVKAEPSLLDVFSYLGFPNVAEIPQETFPSGTYNITLYAEFAGYSDQNELSYYEVNTSLFNVIFAGPEGGSGYMYPPVVKTFMSPDVFGLSMLSPEHRYYTETHRNPDGEQHAKVYRNLDNPNMILIGFENMYGAGDRDYQDMVFSIELQHYLSVVSPYSTPVGAGWYYNGTTAFAGLLENLIDHGNSTLRVFTGWGGDASGTSSPSDPILMDGPKIAVANWKTQYYLTLTYDLGGTVDPPSSGWYDAGAMVPVTAFPDVHFVLDHWKLDGVDVGSDNPFSVAMDTAHALHAVFTYSPPPPLSVSIDPASATVFVGESVSFTSNVTGGELPYAYQWYLDDSPVSGATSNSWVFTSSSPGTYNVELAVTDADNNTARSEVSVVTAKAISIPVGGYSVSPSKSGENMLLLCYVLIVSMFSAALSRTRRKRE